MQRRARRLEAALAALLGVVLAVDQAHEFGHGVAVVPGRAESVLGDEPAGREDDEVGDGGARVVGLRRQDGEDARVRVVEADAADGVEAAQVVLVRVVGAVPGDDVEGRVRLSGRVEVTGEFGQQCVRVGCVFFERSDGGLEIACVGETV